MSRWNRVFSAHHHSSDPDDAEDDYESLPNASVAVNMTAGALAGILEHSVMFPLDAVKTRMQVLNPSPQAIYSSMSNALSRILTTEGFMSLWRGVGSVVLGAGPAHAIYFATYEHCKDTFHNARLFDRWFGATGSSHAKHAASGACAVIAHDAFMNPFDVVKQRMQLYGSSYRGVFDCASKIVRAEGIKALYVSYPTTLMMSIPFQSIQFTTYEHFRQMLNPQGGYNPLTHVTSGAVAGGLASLLTNPLDVTKTLLQTRGTSTDPVIRNASGLWTAAKIIYERDGLKGFTRGMRPRILSHMPSTAVSWSIYEFFRFVLNPARSPSNVGTGTYVPPTTVSLPHTDTTKNAFLTRG
ncbi:mitochondrial carrier [Hyaloraphidium curvatum]|nr:mitochondrial carrier [Hyaloraphidium curvatum]